MTFQIRLNSLLMAGATCVLGLGSASFAGDQPVSLTLPQLPLEAVETATVPGPDYPALWAEDLQNDEKGGAFRFAVPTPVSISPLNRGTWERTTDGRMLWRLRISAPQAMHLNLGFESWNLPPSAEAWFMSGDREWIHPPVTAADNINDGEHWTAIVPGDLMIVEIVVDPEHRKSLMEQTVLTKVNVGYRGFGDGGFRGSSESCNIDVECDEAIGWENEIPSAALYTLNGFLTCSCAMVNNTNEDRDPLVMTAEHCGVSTGNDQSMVVYWNHENSFCRPPGSNQSGGNGDGSLAQFTQGATLLAESATTDFALVRLNSSPPDAFEISYSGWNRSTSTPTLGASIHHPATAEKRISFAEEVYSSGGQGLQLWGVNWDIGRTAPGSSGSPLYNANNQIVGMLCCGASYCFNDSDDYYGKCMANSWNLLSPYLDPAGTGTTSLNTLNPFGNTGLLGSCCTSSGTCVGNTYVDICDSVGGNFFEGTPCDSDLIDCGPSGACCSDDGSCTGGLTENQCAASGGTWRGAGTDCTPNDCPQPPPTGACCLASSSCQTSTADDCSSAGGEYQGDNVDCSFVDCEQADIVSFVRAQRGANLVSSAGVGPNFTTDVYVTVPQGFRVDAMAGNSAQSKIISASNGFLQSSFGGPLSTDINPAFFDLAPGLEFDSYVTIGARDNSGAPFDSNNLQSVGIDFTAFEELGAAITVDNGTWFVLSTDEQGQARPFIAQDCSEQYGVLVARLTAKDLSSTITFDALVQGRDAGNNLWQDRATYTFGYDAGMVDCNGNLVADSCDIANGTSQDADGNGVPDECGAPPCPGDATGDQAVNVDDVLVVIGDYGQSGSGIAGDVNGDNVVNVDDVLFVIQYYDSSC